MACNLDGFVDTKHIKDCLDKREHVQTLFKLFIPFVHTVEALQDKECVNRHFLSDIDHFHLKAIY